MRVEHTQNTVILTTCQKTDTLIVKVENLNLNKSRKSSSLIGLFFNVQIPICKELVSIKNEKA